MKKTLVALGLGCAVLLSGCTESNIVDPQNGSAVPETGIVEGIQIEWNQVQEELDEEFVGSDDYPYGKEIYFYVEDGNAYMMITVEDGVSKEEAANYATEIIKALNDSVAMQDFSYQNDGTSMYGKFSQENVVWIYVMPESTADVESTWLVDDAIVPGQERPVEPNYTDAEWETAEQNEDGTYRTVQTGGGETAAESSAETSAAEG